MKKTAIYKKLDGQEFTVEYDSNDPCRLCGLPVEEASMGGTDVCPWCDCGVRRDGTPKTFKELRHGEGPSIPQAGIRPEEVREGNS